MLSKIKLTNFRKHRHAEFNLQDGFTAFRGANEEGKSTIFEAVAYALFGVKSMRSGLEEAVTWGEAVSTLRVELDMVVDGVIYSISRGKSGAECSYGDQIVTGQNEVTNFVCRLMRVDANAAARLVLSNQNEIRGALESGTKATTDLIERLAEFDQIDKLIELMQEKLALGNGAAAEAALNAAQGRVDRARSVEKPDLEALQAAVDGTQQALEGAQQRLADAQAAQDAATAQLAGSSAAKREWDGFVTRRARLEASYTAAMNELQQLKTNPVPQVEGLDDKISALLAEKADLVNVAAAVGAYEAVADSLGEQSLDYFPGNANDLQIAIDRARATQGEQQSAIHAAQLQISKEEAKLNSGNCTFCGKDFSDLPEVKAKNDAANAAIAALRSTIEVAKALVDDAKAKEAELLAFQAAGRRFLKLASAHAEYVRVDDSTVPPMLYWKGAVPKAGATDAKAIDAKIAELRGEARAHDTWVAALAANERTLEGFGPEREAIKAYFDSTPSEPSTETAQAAVDAAQAVVRQCRAAANDFQTALSDAKGALNDAKRNWEWAEKELASATADVEKARKDLETLSFNNDLLKKVRAARPMIADKLWNLVLSAVSGYFSEMRGVKSVVSKTADGFLIDGKPVQSFSGSTLDILGLAIRVALVRTFLPNAPFLILDEPAAAMDQNRTEAMLGFLVSIGFSQILLVTHEEVSETVADHVILLGAG